ncbi:MAG: Flp pilus assembly complex ATPase component TadA [Sedimentisphaerales bacterium]|nr:Flp pilus assembly complex ATPase component TadA [Sedimentisphaerales bacterium]
MKPSQIPPTEISKSKSKANLLFGELLVSKGLLSRRELIEALNEQRLNGGRLGEVLMRLSLLSGRDVTEALADHLSMECIRFDDLAKIDMNAARSLPESIAKRFNVAAIGEIDGKVIIAMADPLNVIAIDTITLKLNRQLKVVISSQEEIRRAIEVIYHGSDVEEQQLRDLVDLEVNTEKETEKAFKEDLTEAQIISEEAAIKAPVIQFVDLLLSQAIKSRASDVHIEPQEKSMTIRMRIDGVLCDMVPPARKMQAAVVARIKILSKMDIAERRLPQDGRFKIKASGRDIDVRVSAIPTIYGEKIVMRILDASAVNHNLDMLGFEPELLKDFKTILSQPYGIIIVTGPTGSGKSTTLYSALNYLRDPRKNITTVEDPVEYRLAGINQIQVKPEIELDFAKSLRAILRQDPDIVLIGEIRDKETVEIAIKASLTGHLVLSTFHTNDAPSAISRLVYMGIEPYLLASTLNLVIAQRLVRKICDRCKKPVELSEQVLQRLKISPEKARETTFYQGQGCKACGGSGYSGRLPVFEFLAIDNDIRQMLIEGASEVQVRAAARKKGYGGLMDSGVNKIMQGLTTAEEVLSVTFMEDIRL